jgi:hypothetical protein
MLKHKSDVHGEKNAMTGKTKAQFQDRQGRKENLAIAEEKLKEEISKYRYHNS